MRACLVGVIKRVSKRLSSAFSQDGSWLESRRNKSFGERVEPKQRSEPARRGVEKPLCL